MKFNRDVPADVCKPGVLEGHYLRGLLPWCKILRNIYYHKFCLISPTEWQFFARTSLGLNIYELLQSGNLVTAGQFNAVRNASI